MRILLYSDYPALFEALQAESKRYSGIELLQAHPDTEVLTLPDFHFLILAPLAESAEAGAIPPSACQLEAWQEKISSLVELCSLRQAQLILLSSDLVFSPEQQAVSELDTPENPSLLAKTLIQLEEKVAALTNTIILRTPPCLSSSSTGGLAQLIAQIKSGKQPEHINYRGLQPLDDLARVLLGIILQVAAGAKAYGLYHYAGNEAVSQNELFTTLARYLNTKPQSAEKAKINQPTMNSQHLLETFGVHPRAWREKLPGLLELLK